MINRRRLSHLHLGRLVPSAKASAALLPVSFITATRIRHSATARISCHSDHLHTAGPDRSRLSARV